MTDPTTSDYLARLQQCPEEEVIQVLVHDLRNKLAVIRGSAVFVDVDFDHPETWDQETIQDIQELLSVIVNMAEEMENILNAAQRYVAIRRGEDR